MSSSRLSLALEGAVSLPEQGRIAVMGAPAGYDLSALPRDRLQVVQRFFPDHLAWARAGYDVAVNPEGEFCAALVVVPRAKAQARAMIAEALRITDGGLVLVEGQKTDGIDSLLKSLKKEVSISQVISKSHGKLAWFRGGALSGWQAVETTLPGGFVTRPGVFSADRIDKGSEALLTVLPDDLRGHVADLGAGWGYLSRAILERPGVTALDLVEADHDALECARRNVSDGRARFFWDDATTFEPRALCDAVVMNPPFHTGRSGDPELGRAFIRTAARILKPSGRLIMVANRHLPYEQELASRFGLVEELGGTPGFKVLAAAKPRRQRR
ncbi:class I SAM-dependent methyltransferase [Aliiroseovarius sp.]|uniref:class I SAM-dependent methyltransferase n=1 Tax=Aliiroseovarius sp. TaxID=1872442 RepID=UPI002627AEE3|nr:class I SAM-dependent methyltransferase [Aliiroseovarius sp.]